MRKIIAIVALFWAMFLGAIDLQTASKDELMGIKGIGEKKALQIIDYRKTNTIKSADDLKNIKGFGDAIIDNVKNDVKSKDKTSKKQSKDSDEKGDKKPKKEKSDKSEKNEKKDKKPKKED